MGSKSLFFAAILLPACSEADALLDASPPTLANDPHQPLLAALEEAERASGGAPCRRVIALLDAAAAPDELIARAERCCPAVRAARRGRHDDEGLAASLARQYSAAALQSALEEARARAQQGGDPSDACRGAASIAAYLLTAAPPPPVAALADESQRYCRHEGADAALRFRVHGAVRAQQQGDERGRRAHCDAAVSHLRERAGGLPAAWLVEQARRACPRELEASALLF